MESHDTDGQMARVEADAEGPLAPRHADPRPATSRNPETNSALAKALAILEAVASDPYPVRPSDLSSQLGFPRQTTHRVVRQLEDAGLLQRDMTGDRHTIGPRLVRLARATLHRTHTHGPARAVLTDLVRQIGETCNLGMLDGHEVVYIDRVECDWPLSFRLEAGSHVPIHCTAIGKLILAYLPLRTRRRLLTAAPLHRYTATTLTDFEQLEDAFTLIRQQGYSTNDEEYGVGLVAIAVPVRDHRGNVIAGLAMHAPCARTSLERARDHLAILEAAAERIAHLYDENSE